MELNIEVKKATDHIYKKISKTIPERLFEIERLYFFLRSNDLIANPEPPGVAKKACDEDLSKIKSCIKLTGFVNSTNEFIEQPKVINGASDLIALIFGDSGMHTRAAVSTNSLPLGVAVEVDAIFELI